MKKLSLFLLFLLFSLAAVAQKRTKSEQAFIQSLEDIDYRELWEMRERAQDQFQSNLVIGTVVAGWGMGSMASGAIFMASKNDDLRKIGPGVMGVGLGIAIIGGIITSVAARHRKRDLWMEREFWIREKAGLGAIPGGIRLTF